MQPLHLPLGSPAGTADGPLPDTRFAILHYPATAPRGLVVYAHPLGEEMNKSRRMVAMQARALAAAGYAVLLPDLLGCGDSPGDLADATWDGWVNELCAAVHWLRAQAATGADAAPPVTLWGLRSGALLAAAAAARLGSVPRLLLWQPAVQGRTVLQQWLRLQLAGGLMGGPDAPTRSNTDALRQRLLDGQTLDIAGYRMPPALALGLDAARLQPAQGVRAVHAIEVSAREDARMMPATESSLALWQAAGCAVHADVVSGPAFWQTTEIEDAPALVAASLQALQGPHPAHATTMAAAA